MIHAEDYAPKGFRLLVQITEPMSEQRAREYVVMAFHRKDVVLRQGHVAQEPVRFERTGWMVFVPGKKAAGNPTRRGGKGKGK